MPVSFGPAEGEQVFFGAEEVSEILRSEKSGEAASQVARLPVVRRALLERQRAFARAPGLVADGRDMGTVVFPDAVLKVFLTASPEERAHRRHKQLKGKGIDVSLPDLSREIAERDRRDASRSVAPLRPAEGARVVDSTGVTIEEVVARVKQWLAELEIG
jgi:cytidylate kinase